MLIDIIWRNIIKNEGETFYTKTGIPFTYSINGTGIRPSRTNQIIARSEFHKAVAYLPIDGPGIISNIVRGSSYIYAILTDTRIDNSTDSESNVEKMIINPESLDLKQLFITANDKFLAKELSLITTNVAERCICAAMKPFFEYEIKKNSKYKKYHVDVEYNKNAGHVKTIINDKLEVINVTCDFLVHSRGENENLENLIALEMKKAYRPQNEKDDDRNRLIALTKPISTNEIWSYDGKTFPQHVCGFKLGIYYEIDLPHNNILVEYYAEGKLLEISYISLECSR